MGDAEVPLRSILFKDDQNPFFTPKPNDDGNVMYFVDGLNTTIKNMGVKKGDIFLGLDGKMIPEIKQENINEINAIFTSSFMWDDQTKFSITVKRGDEIMTFNGITGSPSAIVSGVINDPNATQKAISLRNAWMKN